MNYLERLLVKKEDIEFLKGLSKFLDQDLTEIEGLGNNYYRKLQLALYLNENWDDVGVKDLKNIIRYIEWQVVRTEGREVGFTKKIDRVLSEINKILNSGKLDGNEADRLFAIKEKIISQESFIKGVVAALQKQVDFFNQLESGGDIKTGLKALLYWVYEEGRLMGWKKAARRQIETSKAIDKDLIVYETLQKEIFPEIVSQNFKIGSTIGNIFFKKGTIAFRAGIVVAHGFFITRKRIELFAKKLADLGYVVFTFDIPGHGEAKEGFNFGLLSEWILESAGYLRTNFGVERVGVIGHSTGGSGALFASCYYNRELETKLFDFLQESVILLKRFGLEGKKEFYEQFLQIYQKVKDLIADSLKKSRFNYGRIDCIVCLSPPHTLQSVSTPLGLFTIRGIISAVKAVKKMYPSFEIKNLKAFHIDDTMEFANYLKNVKNPTDYINLINFFSDKKSTDQKQTLIRYYRDNFIRKIPKLLIYGTGDILLRLWTPWRRRQLEEAYMLGGNCRIVPMERMVHSLSAEFLKPDSKDAIKSIKVGKVIIEFLSQNLG